MVNLNGIHFGGVHFRLFLGIRTRSEMGINVHARKSCWGIRLNSSFSARRCEMKQNYICHSDLPLLTNTQLYMSTYIILLVHSVCKFNLHTLRGVVLGEIRLDASQEALLIVADDGEYANLFMYHCFWDTNIKMWISYSPAQPVVFPWSYDISKIFE